MTPRCSRALWSRGAVQWPLGAEASDAHDRAMGPSPLLLDRANALLEERADDAEPVESEKG